MLEITIEKIRLLLTVLLSSVLAATTPTGGLVTALIVAWAFNVWCGMRADGVTNIRCKNFSWRKFWRASAELILFLLLLETVAVVTYASGDGEEGLYACKTLNYVFVWVYFENGMKNLCKAYPKKKALWIVYLFVRFEFTKIFKIDHLIDMYNEHLQKQDGNITATAEP